MTKHTPGPWRVMAGTRLEIHGPRDEIGYPAIISYNTGIPHDETHQANARLIAAAPELLDAVTGLLMWIAECDHGSEYKANMHKPVAVAKAREALRKAGALDTVAARVSAMAQEPAQ